MPLVDAREVAALDGLWIPDPAYTADTTLYMGVSTTTPTDAGGNVTEPVAGAYARQALVAATFGAASGTAPAVKLNSVAVNFPLATLAWGTLTYAVFFDALTVGNVRGFGVLLASVGINAGDTLAFPIGSILLKLGKPGDTF